MNASIEAGAGRTRPTAGGESRSRRAAVVARAAALLVAGFFVLHGLAHLVGLKDIWGIGVAVTNTTTYLTALDPHSAAHAALGGAWLAAALLFVAAAGGLVLRRRWWLPAAFAAAALSLVLCLLWYDVAVVGLWVDVVILAGLVVYVVLRRLVSVPSSVA